MEEEQTIQPEQPQAEKWLHNIVDVFLLLFVWVLATLLLLNFYVQSSVETPHNYWLVFAVGVPSAFFLLAAYTRFWIRRWRRDRNKRAGDER